MKTWHLVLILTILLMLSWLSAGCDTEQLDVVCTEPNGWLIWDINEVTDTRSLYWNEVTDTNIDVGWISISLPPPPKHRCPVHGVIDDVNNFLFTIEGGYNDAAKMTKVCLRCLSDLINKNVPQLVKIDPNE